VSVDLGLSPVGFGTAALGRSLSRRERVRLLQVAFDCGLTHIDTAPLYGSGAAEEAIGALPAGVRDAITVATKVGYRPPSLVRVAAARAARRAAAAESGLFAPAEVRASLEGSLRRLRRPTVDLVLLHDVQAAAVDDELLGELDALLARGDARLAGIATSRDETQALLARGETFPAVVQVATRDEPVDAGGRGLILHSAIVGRDGDPGALLAAARRPGVTVLFGSRNAEHIRATAAGAL
jgi:aryl-alcohol dehydrogenase-like predicted oxidoreductase